MDFTAIDFETANQARHSACQLATVRIRGGQIVDQHCWLIRPEPFAFSPMNIQVHGIRPERVADQPNFGNLWDEISAHLRGECLVAHNAPFDISVLRACLEFHQVEIPDMEFSCTRLVARNTWPGRSAYGLRPLADWLGIRFRHHDALEDSIACGKVLLAAAETLQVASLTELERKLSLRRGTAGHWGYRGATRVSPPRRPTLKRHPRIQSVTEGP